MTDTNKEPEASKEEHRLDGALSYNGQRLEILYQAIGKLGDQLDPVRLVRPIADVQASPPNTDSSPVVATVYEHGRRIDDFIEMLQRINEDLEV